MSHFNKVHSYFELARFPLCIISALITIEGWALTMRSFQFDTAAVYFSALVTFCAMASVNISNDLLDVDTDSINEPLRPLPSKRVSMFEAKILFLLTLAISIASSIIVGHRMFMLTLLIFALSFAYNIWLKKVAFFGNIVVAGLCVLPLCTAFIILQDGELPLIPLISAFLFLLAREFLGTVCDLEGDKKANRTTIAMVCGINTTLLICLMLSVISAAILFVPLFLQTIKWALIYLGFLIIGLIIPLLFAIKSIYNDQDAQNIATVSYKTRSIFIMSFFLFLFLV
jgi:geranylgeranylglycerol-phosphate geranylgeranyltransferase